MKKIKRVIPVLLLLAAVLLSQGCMRMETEVNVNKDGSGTIDMTMLISEAMVGFAMSMAGEGEAVQDDIPFDRESFEEMAHNYGEDVELVSFEEVSEDGYIGGRGSFSFPDINKIKVALFPEEDGSDYSFEFSEMGRKRKLKIITNNKDSKESEEAEESAAEESTVEAATDEESDEESVLNEEELAELEEMLSENSEELEGMMQALTEQAGLFAGFFEGMYFSFKLNVDGRIVRTNSKHATKKGVTIFEMDMGELVGNEELFAALTESGGKPDNIEDFKDVEGVLFDDNEVIEVIFR